MFSFTHKKRRKEGSHVTSLKTCGAIATKHIIYTYTCVCVYNVYGRNTALFFFFLATGRIHFLNFKSDRSKIDRGPDLACGPGFGHA